MLVQHALENFVISTVELVFAMLAQKVQTAETSNMVEIIVFGDETAMKMESANEAQRALACATTTDKDNRGVRAEYARVRGRTGHGIFNSHVVDVGWDMPGRWRCC